MQDFRYCFLSQIFLDEKNPKRTSVLPDVERIGLVN